MSGRTALSGRGSFCFFSLLSGLFFWAATAALAQDSARPPGRVRTGVGVGQEMQDLEKEVLKPKPAVSLKGTNRPAVKLQDETRKSTTNQLAKPAPPETGEGHLITKLEIRGDLDFLQKEGLLKGIEKDLAGRRLSDQEIQKYVDSAKQALVESGFVLASLWVVPTDLSKGILILQVDKGRVGKQVFYRRVAKPESGKTTGAAYRGRHYSEAQLRRRLLSLREGDVFNYNGFYAAVWEVNSLPDVTMDTNLRARRSQSPEGLDQRYVDMEFTVKDRLPVHGAIAFANSGTEATSEWRPTLTLQHLNLTKHDDILTLNLGPISPNFKALTSYGASYYLPNNWKNGGASTLFAGFSSLDSEDVVEDIDVKGEGWFAGFQHSYKLIKNDNHLLSLALGVTYRWMEDQLILAETADAGEWELDPREVTLVPLSLAFTYSSARPDRIGGRNYLTSQTVMNKAEFLGSSGVDDLRTLRVNADADTYIERLQLARIQPLFGRREKGGPQGWLLFAKVDAQIASGPLVPADQKAIGGMDSVRGFPERIAQGDNGVSGTLELRTPLMSTFLGKRYASKAERNLALQEGNTYDRIQVVAFVDAGYVKLLDSLAPVDNYTIVGAGPGIRINISKYIQFRLDWGFPLVGREDVKTEAEDIPAEGRYHFSIQGQF